MSVSWDKISCEDFALFHGYDYVVGMLSSNSSIALEVDYESACLLGQDPIYSVEPNNIALRIMYKVEDLLASRGGYAPYY